MKGVFLDSDSIAPEDLDLSKLEQMLTQCSYYPSTSQAERLERVMDAEVVITNKIPIDAPLIEAAKQLRLILVAATGANNIDLEAAKKAGVAVANVRGYGPATVAQHTFSLILALATNLMNYTRDVAQGRWSRNHFFCLLHHPIMELSGKNMVIVGYGEIGQAVAKAARGFGMNVLVAESLNPDTDVPSSTVERHTLSELLPIADVISMHCPLTPQTENLIDTEALAAMKPTAFLINVARGGLVDEQALLEALKTQRLGGAGIDVLTSEPPATDHPLLKEALPNLIVTPHSAWGSREARQRLVDEMAMNIDAFVKGVQRNRLV